MRKGGRKETGNEVGAVAMAPFSKGRVKRTRTNQRIPMGWGRRRERAADPLYRKEREGESAWKDRGEWHGKRREGGKGKVAHFSGSNDRAHFAKSVEISEVCRLPSLSLLPSPSLRQLVARPLHPLFHAAGRHDRARLSMPFSLSACLPVLPATVTLELVHGGKLRWA